MNFQTFDLNLLRIFDAVMTEQNITRAAERLSTTQPAVSNALKRLREAADDDILVRTARGMKPTPRAEEIWPSVRAALASLEGVLSPERFDISATKASFRIAMADATATLLLPQLMERVRAEAPDIDIRQVPLPGRDPRSTLLNAEADLAVGSFPGVVSQLTEGQQRDVGLHHQRLYSGEPVCIMREGHPLSHQELTIDRYCSALHLLVSFSGSASGPVDDLLSGLRRSRRIALTVNQFSTAFHMVARSDLLAVVPRHLIEATSGADRLVVRALPFELPMVYVDMLWHERDMRRPAHKWLRDTLMRIPAVAAHEG